MNIVSYYKRNKLFLFCVVFIVIGFFFRSIYIIKDSTQSRDSYEYKEEIAELQKDKEHFSINHPILSISLLGLPSRLFEIDIIRGGVIVNMLLGLLIIVLVIKICYNITKSPLLMLYAGIITASNSDLIYFSTQLLRENSYLFFICAALEILTRKGMDSFPNTFLLSFYTTCAVLCRLEGLEIIIMYTVFKTTTLFLDRNVTGRKIMRLITNYVLYLAFTTLFFPVASLLLCDAYHPKCLGLNKITTFININSFAFLNK